MQHFNEDFVSVISTLHVSALIGHLQVLTVLLFIYANIHKQHNPIRPIVNYRQAPAQKIAVFIANFLKETPALPNTYNIKNSITLTDELKQVNFHPNLRLCPFDIDNMYPNIPKTRVLQIINNICCNIGFATNTKFGINALVKEILEQNLFTHNNITYPYLLDFL
jgi:hypothetical protein